MDKAYVSTVVETCLVWQEKRLVADGFVFFWC